MDASRASGRQHACAQSGSDCDMLKVESHRAGSTVIEQVGFDNRTAVESVAFISKPAAIYSSPRLGTCEEKEARWDDDWYLQCRTLLQISYDT